MRDILTTSAALRRSLEYGDYVPFLERRAIPHGWIAVSTLEQGACLVKRATIPRGWDSGALARAQELATNGAHATVKVRRFGGSAIGACVECGAVLDARESHVCARVNS